MSSTSNITGAKTASVEPILKNVISINSGTVIAALLVLAGGFLTKKIADLLISRYIGDEGSEIHASKSARQLVSYIIYPVTLMALLGVFGVPLSGIGAFAGLIGLGISFALKDIIANFISGILIMIHHPVKIGDQIEVNGFEGTIQDIRTRATDIKTYDGRKVIVPNSTIYNSTLVNNTGYGKRRFSVVVGIGYEEDIKEAKELAEEVLDEADSVDNRPEPQVLVDELAGSSVNLKLRGWSNSRKGNLVTGSSEVSQLIKEKYDEAGIDIPFPIRTIIMDSDKEA